MAMSRPKPPGPKLNSNKLMRLKEENKQRKDPNNPETDLVQAYIDEETAKFEEQQAAELAAAEETARQEALAKIPNLPRKASFISSGSQSGGTSNFRSSGGPGIAPHPVVGRSRRSGPSLLGG